MKHILYRLKITKIEFEQYRLIDTKLCQLTFNYPRFHITSHFVQYIWDYCIMINYDTIYSKVAHKYLLKIFYNKMNKKEYNLQVR